MRGGFIPDHFMFTLGKDEGNRLRELLDELRSVERGGEPYRMNLNEAEDELLETLVDKLRLPD